MGILTCWRLLRYPRAIDPNRSINTSNALPLGFLGSGAVFSASAVAGRRLRVRGRVFFWRRRSGLMMVEDVLGVRAFSTFLDILGRPKHGDSRLKQ